VIVEIVIDASVGKDTRRLPEAYFRAGVAEYWLADARREELSFHIHRRGESAFEPVTPDANGFQRSVAFNAGFRLEGARNEQGGWAFDLLAQ
jgi:Uma2 family endonuclease